MVVRRHLRPPRSPRSDGSGRHRARPSFEERFSHYSAAGVAVLVVSASTYTMVTPAEVPIPTFEGPDDVQQYAAPAPLDPPDPPVPPVPRASMTRATARPLARPQTAGSPAPSSPPPASTPPDDPAPEQLAAPDCEIENRWDDVEPRVRQVACMLDQHYPGIANLLGVAPRGLAGSGHPRGLAVDVLVNDDRVTGDKIAACAAAHFTDWDLDYVLWRQASLEEAGGHFERMRDRGGRTANHYDHVHLSFHDRSEPIPAEALNCADEDEEEEGESRP